MILKKFADRLYDELMNELTQQETDDQSDLKKRGQLIWTCVRYLQRLKDFFMENPPANDADEIAFFKVIKPKFKAQLLYQQFLYKIESKRPAGELDAVTTFYKRELKSITRYHKDNLAFCQYYRSGAEHLDQLYFLRNGARVHPDPFTASVDFDNEFNTSHDHKVARILANDLLIQRLGYIIKGINQPELPYRQNENEVPISWTQTKSGLIELIYSLHETKAIDNGNITLKRLAGEFEKIFNVSLGNFYDTFDWIACRPRPTTYLDELKDALRTRIDKKLK